MEVFSDGSCRYGSPSVSICPLSISVSSPWRCSQSDLVVLLLSPYQLFLLYQFVLSVSVCPLRISRSYRISLSFPNQSFSFRISYCHDARLLRHSLASWHKTWQFDGIPVTTQEFQPKLLRRGNSISQNSCVVATPSKPINRQTANWERSVRGLTKKSHSVIPTGRSEWRNL